MDPLEQKISAARPRPEAAARERLDARFAERGRARGRARRALLPALGGLCAMVMAVAVVAPELGERDPGSAGEGGEALIMRTGEGAGAHGEALAGDGASAPQAEIARPGIEPGLPIVPPGYPPADPAPGEPRRAERSAFIDLITGDVEAAAGEAGRIADRHDGYVQDMDVSRSAGAALQLRVPATRLTAVMSALAELGEVRDRGESSRDITAGFVHARERIAVIKARRASLLRQLERAADESERRSIEAQLESIDAELRAARAERRGLQARAEYARVAVSIRDPEAAERVEAGDRLTPGVALERALGGLVWLASVAVYALVIAAPLWLIAIAAWLLRRRRHKA